MPGTITINEALVGTNGVSLTRSLPTNVLNLDIQITSSDWATLSGTVDFLIECNIGGSFVEVLRSTGNALGFLSPKGTGLPHFFVGSTFLGPATQIRITATPTTPVHLGLVVQAG
jgi:hypothetical protein